MVLGPPGCLVYAERLRRGPVQRDGSAQLQRILHRLAGALHTACAQILICHPLAAKARQPCTHANCDGEGLHDPEQAQQFLRRECRACLARAVASACKQSLRCSVQGKSVSRAPDLPKGCCSEVCGIAQQAHAAAPVAVTLRSFPACHPSVLFDGRSASLGSADRNKSAIS